MAALILKGRTISKGLVEGKALISTKPILFFAYVDPNTGKIMQKDHPLEGKSILGKILFTPSIRGTVYTWKFYKMVKSGNAPKAIIVEKADVTLIATTIFSGIPCLDMLENNPQEYVKTGNHVKVDATNGFIEI